jgi:hypothetical protein
MVFALLITIGASVYNYDHLSYKDLETCEYHKGKVEQLLFYTKEVTVTCHEHEAE